jgi:tripartite-type tricarboxylate transporter receptor subunit TctC
MIVYLFNISIPIKTVCLSRLAVFISFVLIFNCVFAQDFPNRQFKIIVPSASGGGTDILARSVAQKITETLKQSAIVENRTGGGSIVGSEYVARSLNDGYTILMGSIANMVMNKILIPKLPYDPEKDFLPIGYISAYPFVLMARADLPINNFQEFVQYVKSRPDKLSFGSAGIGTLQHVWFSVLLNNLNLQVLHIPFKGAAPVHQEMLGGRIDFMFDNMSAAKQYVLSRRLKGIAVSSLDRTALLPNVPTINESGITKFDGESWFGLFVPVNTPTNIVNKLRQVMSDINRDTEFVSKVERDGGRMLNLSPENQQIFLRDELSKWSAAIQKIQVSIE